MRPQAYHDWRRLLQSAYHQLGFCCEDDARESRCAKNVYRLRHRIRRLRKRIDAEAEAFTMSFGSALLEQLESWVKRRNP